MTIRLDHVGVVGREMTSLLQWGRSLGFAPTEPKPLYGAPGADGKPVPLGQESAHIVLQQGYVELSAVTDLDRNTHLAPYLRRRAGLLILAFETDDIDGARRQCAAFDPSPVQRATREITYGNAHGWARFDWFMLDPPRSPDGLVCFVRPHDKALIYQDAVTAHPNQVAALTGIDLLGDDETRDRYEKLVGPANLEALGLRFVAPGPREHLPSAPAMVGFEVETASETRAGTATSPSAGLPYVRFVHREVGGSS